MLHATVETFLLQTIIYCNNRLSECAPEVNDFESWNEDEEEATNETEEEGNSESEYEEISVSLNKSSLI